MLTVQEITAAREKRGRLERIASAVGLALDEDNHRLVHALETLDYELRSRSGSTTATSSSSQSAPGAQHDVGDIVAELMRAKHEGRAPAAWATAHRSQKGKVA